LQPLFFWGEDINYYIGLDRNSFDNVPWQIIKPTMSVSIEPNHYKLIEVPVAVMGEVSGTVYLKNDKGESGLARIIINIYDSFSIDIFYYQAK